MFRVRIWVSASRDVDDALVLVQNDGKEHYYAFNSPPGGLDWLGAGYESNLFGLDGISYDLPRGFPTNLADAELRMRDPSIPKAMRLLIRLSFPLRPRSQPVSRQAFFQERVSA